MMITDLHEPILIKTVINEALIHAHNDGREQIGLAGRRRRAVRRHQAAESHERAMTVARRPTTRRPTRSSPATS